ncbi:MAG: response regulator [Spirochaetia bacterium]|jgi:DNA-binding response OmpR family regulator|nr:response regulator [Spirochaetia bacterium]
MAKKTVLVIDESDLFRDYLKSRLGRAGLQVETAINGLDGISKMRLEMPDLVIMDYHLTKLSCKQLLEEKARNPNTAPIPVILTAQKIDKGKLLELVQFNIRKVFMKPLKIDAMYQVLADVTGVRLELDETPCMIEAHVNDNIVFIEIAQGINREKVDLLRFKIRELLDLYTIRKVRILVMLADMELSFIDGHNMEFLLQTVIAASGAKGKHIKVLTRSAFMRDFVAGRPEFKEIEVVDNLEKALDGLVADAARPAEAHDENSSAMSTRFLSSHDNGRKDESVDLRFQTEQVKPEYSLETAKDFGSDLEIAVVDDDFVIQELLKTTFEAINATVHTFSNGREFLGAARNQVFDLVFLDLRMPELDGFGVLTELHSQDLEMPIIVLSAVTQRESVVRAFKAGVKSYLVKPLKPEQIVRKSMEILKANF